MVVPHFPHVPSIALDCYQHTFLGLGVAKSIPAPPPYSYLRTGFSPATFRRGIPLRRCVRRWPANWELIFN